MRLFALFTIALCFIAAARAQDATFVVNKETKVAAISPDDARNILLGKEINLADGTVIKLVVQTDGIIQERIVREYTQRSTDQFEKYWLKQVFTGKGMMPTHCKSDAEVIAFVAKTPGAFGYVAKTSLTDAVSAVGVTRTP